MVQILNRITTQALHFSHASHRLYGLYDSVHFCTKQSASCTVQNASQYDTFLIRYETFCIRYDTHLLRYDMSYTF